MRDGESGPLAGVCRRLGIHHPTFAVTVLQFGSCLMNTSFHFYYVKVFLNHYKISESWFQLAQVLFMVWNSINDPLFGFFQDIGGSWMRSRTKSILFGAPFYSLFFLLFWFPWGGPDSPSWLIGLHLIVALFLYDAVFSFALLAWCALFAEVTTDPAGRVRVVKYTQFAVLMGVNVILVLEKVSNSLQDFRSFQLSCFVIAGIGFICVTYTGLYAPTNVAQVKPSLPSRETSSRSSSGESIPVETPWTVSKAWAVTKQVLAAKDFRRITATNFLQTCRTTCHLNFAAIFSEGLIPRSVMPLGSWEISIFYGICAVLPQLLLILNSSLVLKLGVYNLMMKSFVSSVCFGVITFLIGRQYPFVVITYMIIDSIQVHTFSPLMNILFPDFIDDDMERHDRKTPVSSIVFSLNALFTKPAQSISPMIVVYFLNLYGYEQYKAKTEAMDPAEVGKLQDCMFTILTLTSALLAFLQYQLLWRYTLRDKHLSDDKKTSEILTESLVSGL